MSQIALVVIYNHRYERNIPLIEKIYGARFSHIFHLMPFYTGCQANVIPVYESSHQFQGYIAQGFLSYRREEFTHYFFIADDLLLHPGLNEQNFAEFIGLRPGQCYLPGYKRFKSENLRFWAHEIRGYEWTARQPGVEAADLLPSVEQAQQLLARHGIAPAAFRFEDLWAVPQGWRRWLEKAWDSPGFVLRYLSSRLRRTRYPLPYPLTRGYSDMFIVEAGVMQAFVQYCGIFAATGLWVEHAIPTALALATDAIADSPATRIEGRALWGREDLAELQVYEGSLKALLDEFPPDCLYLHPVKLSQWVVDIDEPVQHKIPAASILEHPGSRNEIAHLFVEGTDLVLNATGRDPYLDLPRVSLDPERDCVMIIDISCPVPTMTQLFFCTLQVPEYSEQNSQRWTAPSGRHRHRLKLPASLSGRFRLDPGVHPGTYRIHEITVRQ